jgi:MurNAc alpha-1-phosphate uridylyltransferase
MDELFANSKIKNTLLVVNKKLSFDKYLSGDFNLQNNQLTKSTNNEYIYTGCQIFSRNLLNFNTKKVFSITEIWNALIEQNNLFGYESKNKFSHVTNLEIYNKLLKN